MNNMTITSATYMSDPQGNHLSVYAIIDGQELFVPIDLNNRHYAEIMRQVEAGTLIIQEAE